MENYRGWLKKYKEESKTEKKIGKILQKLDKKFVSTISNKMALRY